MIVFYRIHLIYYKTTYVYKYLTHSYKYLYEKFKKENIRNYSEFCKTIKSMRLMHIHEPTEQWSWILQAIVLINMEKWSGSCGLLVWLQTDDSTTLTESSRVISSSKVNAANYWVSHLRFHSLRSLSPWRTQWMWSSKLKSHSPRFPWHLNGIYHILLSYCRASVSHTETLSPI